MNRCNERSVWTAWRGALLVSAAALAVSLSLGTSWGAAKKRLVNINTATQGELEAVKGVDSATAGKIIAKRPYKSVAELSRAGLSAKKIESLQSFLTVGAATEAAGNGQEMVREKRAAHKVEPPASTQEQRIHSRGVKRKKQAGKLVPGQKVNINTAGKEELEKLPGIGPVKAQRIIDGRPYHRIEEVMRVKGIKRHTFGRIKDYITVR